MNLNGSESEKKSKNQESITEGIPSPPDADPPSRDRPPCTPPLDSQTHVKTLPCPKRGLREVKMTKSKEFFAFAWCESALTFVTGLYLQRAS